MYSDSGRLECTLTFSEVEKMRTLGYRYTLIDDIGPMCFLTYVEKNKINFELDSSTLTYEEHYLGGTLRFHSFIHHLIDYSEVVKT